MAKSGLNLPSRPVWLAFSNDARPRFDGRRRRIYGDFEISERNAWPPFLRSPLSCLPSCPFITSVRSSNASHVTSCVHSAEFENRLITALLRAARVQQTQKADRWISLSTLGFRFSAKPAAHTFSDPLYFFLYTRLPRTMPKLRLQTFFLLQELFFSKKRTKCCFFSRGASGSNCTMIIE